MARRGASKFKVGQVVCIRPSTFKRITEVKDHPVFGWSYSIDLEKPKIWFPEERLRPLTSREKGERK